MRRRRKPMGVGFLGMEHSTACVSVSTMSTDWELLEQWRQGDANAGNELVKRHYKAIARYFANKVSNRDEAADLISQTFLACTERRDHIRNTHAFRSYLFGIAHHCLHSFFAAKLRLDRERTDFAVVCAKDISPPSPNSILVQRREEMLVLQALRELSIEQQTVLELNLLENLSGSEIAALLGISEGTVRSRLRLGLERLRRRIGELAVSPDERESTLSDLAAWARNSRAVLDDEDET